MASTIDALDNLIKAGFTEEQAKAAVRMVEEMIDRRHAASL